MLSDKITITIFRRFLASSLSCSDGSIDVANRTTNKASRVQRFLIESTRSARVNMAKKVWYMFSRLHNDQHLYRREKDQKAKVQVEGVMMPHGPAQT